MAQRRWPLRDAEEHLASARTLQGEERAQVVADLESEHRRLAAAWKRLTVGPERAAREQDDDLDDDEVLAPGTVQLQVSWEPGRVVAWAAGPATPLAPADDVTAMLTAAGAPASGWIPHAPVPVPGVSGNAEAFGIPVGEVLGWLVAAGAGEAGDDVAPSVRWLGRVAIWAVELTARGAMVPLLRQRKRGSGNSNESNASYSVRWTPALIEPTRLASMVSVMPRAVLALDPKVDARALTRSALTGMVDAICRDSARRLEVPAPPPRIRTATDVAEAFLARLDGSAFDAPLRLGGEISARVERWGRSVTGEHARLVVRLDPPDDGDAWRLAVLAAGRDVELVPIEQAIVDAGPERRDIEDEIARLERLLPALMRPGGTRRGQVILSQDEAWELMTVTGAQLLAAGFDVRVPALSRRKPTASLRVFAETASTSVVGANQLADVRWSALFDDVELTAADIARLAKEARPLIRSGGRWVAVDRADLNEAAAALAERSKKTQLSGRRDAAPRARPRRPRWPAASRSAAAVGPPTCSRPRRSSRRSRSARPTGFVGELRSYQAEALAWLGFLDSVGLGGCLALDMGLGKTPTMLARLLSGAGTGPALVIAPPAVVGNWAAEAAPVHARPARRRAPRREPRVGRRDRGRGRRRRRRHHDLRHRRARRRRDREVAWDRVILDEAQAIKNPANDTSQQLRRIPARRDVALTGTPIENGLGDLWAILDFTNPGLVGTRPQFIAALSRDSDSTRRSRGRDARSTASSSSGARRPSRRSRPSCPTRSTSSTTAR